MSLTEKALVTALQGLDEKAKQIENELKAACPKRSGEAANSIHIEETGEYTRRIGAVNSHLFFADQGNNQTKSTIYPVRAKALRFDDGSFHGSASAYEGSHFVRKVADKHR